jgi:hypothetical protein
VKVRPFKAGEFFPETVSAVPKMGQEEYFRLNREPNRIDERVAGTQASCCGVNLALAGSGVRGYGGVWGWAFPQAVKVRPFKAEEFLQHAGRSCAGTKSEHRSLTNLGDGQELVEIRV